MRLSCRLLLLATAEWLLPVAVGCYRRLLCVLAVFVWCVCAALSMIIDAAIARVVCREWDSGQ